ncbi:MAG: lytic transglycosylase F [Desulfobacterales bacterium S7086C20]|nr:MAG: lytic transglycosylase F [Desulfobacterales bacterium S7086C20]
MKQRWINTLLIIIVCLSVLGTVAWVVGGFDKRGEVLERIKEKGKITVITSNNSNCYYIYRDRPMGFEYELAKAFADYLDVKLEVITPDWDEMLNALDKDKGDLVAASMTSTPDREEIVDFSDEYLSVQQDIIVHKGNHKIKGIEDLSGKKVHVREGTSYHERLLELKKDGLDVEIILHENVPTEELIRQVAEKEIEITVADSNIALLNRRYYPAIRIAFPIEEQQSLGWAVRKGNSKLLAKINKFFDTIEEDGTFGKIYEKYYANVDIFDFFDLKKFHQRIETRLPKYEKIIKRESNRYGFDWRLMAAVAYQESHLDPRAKSYKGVRGLMQLTLTTAEEMEIDSRLDPQQSIEGGIKYLSKIYKRFDKIEGLDRMLFTLASYNIGYGHVRDAQKLALQKDLDTHKWASLKKTLPMLRQKKYYKKTKYGYCRGTEPVRYVDRVLTYYDILKRKALE